jgi:hypothetical protein
MVLRRYFDRESKTSTEIEDQNMATTTTSCIINEAITRPPATIKSNKINRQRNKNIKMKVSLNEPININEVNSLVSAELLKNIGHPLRRTPAKRQIEAACKNNNQQQKRSRKIFRELHTCDRLGRYTISPHQHYN